MKNKNWLIVLTLTVFALVLGVGLRLDQNQPVIASDQSPADITLGVTRSQELVINIYYDSQQQLNSFASELDVWEVHSLPGIGPSAGYAVAAVTPSEKDWLEVQGYRVELNQEKTEKLREQLAALDPRYYYFDDYFNNSNNLYMVDFLQETNAAYPTLTELFDIGDAWLATQGEYQRDMWVLRITNEDPQYGEIASKPPFFLMANIHAREVTTPEMAIRYIKYLTQGYLGQGGYGIDPDVSWLVNHHVVYVMVSQNPDGHEVNEEDWTAYWRKNVDSDDGCGDPNSCGVDLNRNSNFMWGCCGGSSGNPCSETYRGPTRGSEPETEAMQTFVTQVFQDWNGPNGDDEMPPAAPDDTVGIFISLHSYQDEILWAYECYPDCGQPPNSTQLKTIGRKLADITGVMIPTGFLYTVDGGTIDFVYGKLGIPAYTYEIGPVYGTCGDFFPPYGCQDGIDGMPRNFWAEMGPSFVYANKIAGSPYITAYGPDAQNVAVNPTSVPGGLPVDLTATIIDQRYSSDPLVPIAAAEYFIDAPGEDGSGMPMSSSDGSWGETTEDVQAVVDTSGMLEGQHYLLVHGMNEDGFWGPLTAVFLDVTTPAYGVMLIPETGSAQDDPGTVVTYKLQVTNIGQNTDTYDVLINSQWTYEAPTTIGPLDPIASDYFDFQVTIPFTATNGESDIATVMVQSQAVPDVVDTSELTTTANFYALNLSPAADDGEGNPGEQVSYTLHLTNLGNLTDSFELQASGMWNITLPAAIGPVEPGAGMDFEVLVDVPLEATPGDFDVAMITATSQGNENISATSTLTTSVITVYTFDVNPIEDTLVGHGLGADVEFTILITNTGNITDSYEIILSPDSGDWLVDYPSLVGPLAKGASTSVSVTVHIPFDILMGDSNLTILSILSEGGSAGHQVTLTTHTFWYSSYIPLSLKH